MVEVVEDLERTGKVKDVDFTGTTWRLAFSTSTTESAGKLGPFTGRVRQARSRSTLCTMRYCQHCPTSVALYQASQNWLHCHASAVKPQWCSARAVTCLCASNR